MKFLIVCREAPTQLISARMFKLAKYLRTFHDVTLICQKSESILPLTHAGIKVIVETSNFEKLAQLSKKEFDVIIFSNWFLAKVYYAFVKKQFTDAKIVIDASDLQFVRDEQMLLLNSPYVTTIISSGEVLRNRDDELDMYSLADVCWVSSVNEKNILQKLSLRTKIEVIPTICSDTNVYTLVKPWHSAYFVGNSYRQSDIDATEWYMNEIFGSLKAEFTDFTTTLIGNYDEYFIEQHNREGIKFKTFRSIEYDVNLCLRQYAICVLPIRFYSGSDERLVQALVNNIPVVTTSVIASSLNLIDRKEIMIANTAEEFIKATDELLSDTYLQEEISINARRKLFEIVNLEQINENIYRNL